MRSCADTVKASGTCTRAVSVSRVRRRVQAKCAAQDIVTPSTASATNLMERLEGVAARHQDTVLLQGFGWESCHAGGWWKKIAAMAPEIAEAGFTHIWLPPPSQSVDPHGYLPSQLYNFNSAYGTESELRECLIALKAVGVKPVADLVLNHRCADTQDDKGEWIIFSGAHEPEGVATCAWGPWAVTNNDPEFGGTGAKDTGDDFHAAPDIDHTHPAVQAGYADWIRYLVNDVGFEGVRFDFSKGYAGKYAGQYSRETIGLDYFAVGEYWKPLKYDIDGKLEYDQERSRKEVLKWMNDAGEGVTAFDFVTKGILQEAIRFNKYDWLVDKKNNPHGLIGLAKERSVTFVDNHDTGSTQAHWRFPRMKKLEGYAYILTHPGMPTVFWEHLFEESDSLKEGILQLVALRRRVDIQANSEITVKAAKPDVYIADIEGNNGTVRVKLGPSREMYGYQATEEDGWVKSAKGADFCVWEKLAQTAA